MGVSPSSWQEIRAQLGALEKTQKETLPYSWLPGGLPRGALVELAGPGKTEFAARMLAEHPELAAAWVEESLSLFPPALAQRQVNLETLLLVEGGSQSAWAAGALLRSGLFAFLLYEGPSTEERELRRFQLLAERSRCTMVLLRESLCRAWPISLSLQAQGGELRVERRR